jgi:predicted nucleic acid-binding protein
LPEVICDTSALQYLYQLEMLWVLEALAKHIVVPPAVVEELAVGRSQGIQLPDPTSLEWVTVRAPAGATVLPLVTDLGPGETEVLALALESSDALVIRDDGLARQVASMLLIRFRGTLGLLLDAKAAGLVKAVKPFLDQLQGLGFRLHSSTRETILDLAGELP